MQPGRVRKTRRVWLLILLQLALSYVVVGIVARASYFFGGILIILLWPAVGLLLTWNLARNLRALATALEKLASKTSLKPLSLRGRWPLTPLFNALNTLAQGAGKQGQLTQQTTEYRDQLLQQVGKTAAQEERNRLARDLHDSIKQQIFSIAVSTAAVKVRWESDPASARKTIDDIEVTAREAQVEMQALLQQLRPVALENVGLIESLRMQCQALGYRTGAQVVSELGELPGDEQIPLGAQEMLFRIVQEGFANIARHARATHVWLSLYWQHNALLLEIGDDGQGFDLASVEQPNGQGGMGLFNVRERVQALAGSVTIWSQPDRGTTLHVYLPLAEQSSSAQEEEEPDPELVAAARKARRITRFGVVMAELAAACILLYTPLQIAIFSVGIGLVLAFAAWLWSQRARREVTAQSGTHARRERLSLLAASSELLARILWVAGLYAGYFYASHEFSFWALASIAGICAIVTAAALLCILYYWQSDRAYQARDESGEQLSKQFDRLVIDSVAWCCVAGSMLFLSNVTFSLDFLHLSGSQWVPNAALLMLIAWLLFLLANWAQIVRWHRLTPGGLR